MLIKNGTIVDGNLRKAYRGDIRIRDGMIVALGDAIHDDDPLVIDAADRIVAPGFIDTHSHSDLRLLIDSKMEPKVRQGITTEIIGQDGISMAPLPIGYIDTWRKNIAGLNGESDLIDWKYRNTLGYLNQLATKKIQTNVGYLAPHGNIRMEAMGLAKQKATQAELGRMKDIVRREFESGALGLSTGLIYVPCAYGDREELTALSEVVAEYRKILVVHQRSEADTILESMDEMIDISRKTGVRLHFSHFKICGQKNWRQLDKVLDKLDQAIAEGLAITFDQYPYIAGSTMLGVILPPWAHDGGTDRLLQRLRDSVARKKMAEDIKNGIAGWDNFIDFAGYEGIYITSVKHAVNETVVGKNLLEIGEIRGKEPLEAAMDLLVEEENAVGMVDFYGKEQHLIQILRRKEGNVCTDGLLSGKPHPRVYGSFPRVLARYVKEQPILSLEEAVHKMTFKAAQTFSLSGRGAILEGYHGDLVIFDFDRVRDLGTYQEPAQYPLGIETVIINGAIVYDGQTVIPAGKGQILKN